MTEIYDMVGGIIAYETGELDEAGMLELFAYLIAMGFAWELQGRYGRTAKDLIDEGYISPEGEILREV